MTDFNIFKLMSVFEHFQERYQRRYYVSLKVIVSSQRQIASTAVIFEKQYTMLCSYNFIIFKSYAVHIARRKALVAYTI